jgi:hypothetical protein
MQDQVSMDAQVEAVEQVRWDSMEPPQQRQALADFARFIETRQDLANALAARDGARTLAERLAIGGPGPTPIDWQQLTPQDLAHQLRDMGGALRETDREYSDLCFDLAEEAGRERNRSRSRDDRGR